MFTPVETKDGSCTFYSEAFGEWFHNKNGACNEAQTTYVDASDLAGRAQADELRILDVCYGLGYNTAAALETIWRVNPRCRVQVKGLEIDIEVARSAIAHNLVRQYSPQVQQVLQQLADGQVVDWQDASSTGGHSLFAQILLGDARQTIQRLIEQNWQADVIFFDPFSPPHCPQLWTVEFLRLVARCLEPERGVLVTYSCAAAVRAAFGLAGFSIGSIHTGGRRWPGTIACLNDRVLPPLSAQEREHLQTRAAVPYCDPALRGSAAEILEARSRVQATSELLPTKRWRQRWQKNNNAGSTTGT